MTRFFDNNRTIDVFMGDFKTGVDSALDLLAGDYKYDDEREAYKVNDIDILIYYCDKWARGKDNRTQDALFDAEFYDASLVQSILEEIANRQFYYNEIA